MSNIISLGFQKPEIHLAADGQLRRLTGQAKRDFFDALEHIRREGPENLSGSTILVRETPFLRKVQRLALFMVGRVLGMIEVFRRNIKLVAALDLDVLGDREHRRFATVWAQAGSRMRGGTTYDWSAAFGISSDNHLWFVQKTRRSSGNVQRMLNSQSSCYEVDMHIKVRGCALLRL
ncbi:hypothetical protein FHR71_003949 [Methylobacterium sp. RAS18]|nr:hypothetical protein [Methylobacterium sp. RAS18]